jgi:hypothetical protein
MSDMRYDFVLPVFYSPEGADFIGGIARHLRAKGATAAVLTHNRYLRKRLEQLGHGDLFDVYDGFDPKHAPSIGEQRRAEERLGIASLHDLVFPEAMMPGARPIPQLVRRAVHDVRFLEQFLEQHEVRFFVNDVGPELLRRCMFRLRDRGGPENLLLDFAPIPKRIAITTHEVFWDDLPNDLPELDAVAREVAEGLRRDALERRKPFAAPTQLTFKGRNLVNAAKYMWVALRERNDFSLSDLFTQRAESFVRIALNDRVYVQPVPDEEFFFFPLHLADDSAITVRAPQFQQQEDIIRHIAERALPAGTCLYVKPHPGAMHAYSVEMIRKLAKIPRVKVIDPRINSHALIAAARLVIVINSTVGFESLLYGKPVVSLGRVFYRGRGLTIDVENAADLVPAVARGLSFQPSSERFLQFLHACYAATYPGRLNDRSEENLELLADALLDKASRLQKHRSRPANKAMVS